MADMTEERLAKIERQQERCLTLLETLTERVEDRIAQDAAWRGRIERMLYGDGNGYRGLVVRLDRLEQAQERQKWLVRTLLATVATLAGHAFFV